MYLIEKLRTDLAEALSAAAGADLHEHLLEYPELPENGDLAFPCFTLAKHLKKAPPAIAAELAAAISLPEGFVRAEAKGPYLNFFLDRESVVAKATEEALETGSRFGDRKVGHDEKVMVEFISPNNNKPLHLGHVRNGLIGESVSALLESQGHEVVRTMVLNDRGLAIAKAMVAYAKWGEGKTPESAGMKGDHFVAEWYVMFESKLKAGETWLEQAAQDVIEKWEAEDPETRALWKTMGEWCVRGQHETYARFGFRFDAIYKESDIYKGGKAIVEEGIAKGAFKREEDGHVEVKLEPFGMPDKVLLRSNGTALYITQDLFLAKKKFDDYDLDRSMYVVGNEQNLQFRQLFKILELAGYPWAANLEHLSYGYVTLPEGRMKSREGTVVDADDLLSALEADAALEIRQRHPALSDDELVRRAHHVALAAVKFYFMEVDIASDMVYDPKASLAFTGKTGPYLQYMHARIRSIMRKQDQTTLAEAGVHAEGRHPVEEEFRLAMSVARFPEAVRRAAESSRPSLVAAQIYEVAKAVAALYEKAHVLSASKEDRDARLKLLEAADAALVRGMALLGFSAPDEM